MNRSDSAFSFAVPSVTPLAASPATNTAEFYQAKTLAHSFTVGAYVKGVQVIYQQGGDGFAFLDTDHKLAQHNAALTGADLQKLVKFLADGVIHGIPVAPDDRLLTDEKRTATVDVLANDSDPDGEVLAVSTVGATSTGAAALNADGTIISVSDADHH